MCNQQRAEALEGELLQLFADIDATTYVALQKLASFEGFAKLGFHSMAHWLSFRVGLSIGTAREHVRVASALAALPKLSAAMQSGWLSYSKVRALTRIATPETEDDLLAMCIDATATQIEKIVRKVRWVDRAEAEQQFEHHKHENAADSFLAAFSAQETTEVIVHVEANDTALQIETARGDRVSISAETARRASCDASVVVMTHDSCGSVLDVGRKTRKIPIALKRALHQRDGGCRYPSCASQRTHAHHVRHWADGGETSLENTILLCSFHHHLLHEGGYTIEDGTFFDNRGRMITATGDWTYAEHKPQPGLAIWNGPTWHYRTIDYGLMVADLCAKRPWPHNPSPEDHSSSTPH